MSPMEDKQICLWKLQLIRKLKDIYFLKFIFKRIYVLFYLTKISSLYLFFHSIYVINYSF